MTTNHSDDLLLQTAKRLRGTKQIEPYDIFIDIEDIHDDFGLISKWHFNYLLQFDLMPECVDVLNLIYLYGIQTDAGDWVVGDGLDMSVLQDIFVKTTENHPIRATRYSLNVGDKVYIPESKRYGRIVAAYRDNQGVERYDVNMNGAKRLKRGIPKSRLKRSK